MRRRAFIGSATAAALIAPNVARAQILGPPGGILQQLTLGVNVPLSGPLAAYGRDVVSGVQAAADETNRFNATLRQAFGVRSFDDRNDPQTAVTNVSIAQADPSIIGMIGNLTAATTLGALASYANANFGVIVPTVTTDSITERNYRNVYRLATKDSTEGQLAAQTLLPSHARGPAVAVTMSGDYGPDLADGFVRAAKSARYDSQVVTLDAKSLDPALAARTVLALKPAHIFLAGRPADLGPVVEAIRLTGFTGVFSCGDGFYTQTTLNTYQKALDGAMVASSMPPLNKIPSAFQLLLDLQHEVSAITAFTAYGYAAAQIIISASQRTNATTRFTLLNTLQVFGSYNTLVGQFSFNFNGDATIPNVYFYRIGKDGFTYQFPAVRTGYVL